VYCPLCRAQYTAMREGCADCGYQKLLEFEKETGAKPAVQ
jgi:predicted  nucleic acid-binding Zn-ribbon protein